MKKKHIYLSCLSKNEITAIVASQKPGWLSNGICGKVSGSGIKIFRKSITKGLLVPVFYGVLTENKDGTIISGQLQLFKSVIAYMWLLRIMILLPNLIFFTDVVGILFSSVVLLFSFIIPRNIWFLGEHNRAEILEFIEQKLMATPADTDSI